MGLFPGRSFSSRAAAALLARPLGEVERALESLVDADLLEAPAVDYYRFHDLLWVYARELAEREETPEDRRAACHRVAAWYLYACREGRLVLARHPLSYEGDHAAALTEPAVAFPDRDRALAWFDAERSNLLGMVRMCAAEDLSPFTWLLPIYASMYHIFRAAWSEGGETMGLGPAAAREHGDLSGQAALLVILAARNRFQGRFDAVLANGREAASIFAAVGNVRGLAHATASQADALTALGRVDEAVHSYREAVEGYRSIGAALEAGMVLNKVDDRFRGADSREHYGDVLGLPGKAEEAVAQWDAAARCFLGVDDERAALILEKIRDPHITGYSFT